MMRGSTFLILSILFAAPAGAETLFDLGNRRVERIVAENDAGSWEEFQADAFGVFPTGSWVWEELTEIGCDQVRWPEQVCWNGAFVRAFRLEFNDGGCGCGGFLEIPSMLRLTWSEDALAARGISEVSLQLVYNYSTVTRAWQPVTGAVRDLDANAFTVTMGGDIIGIREFAIVTDRFVPTSSVTWSGIKRLFAR